eukprot:Gb_11827 [translate_table: standard]
MGAAATWTPSSPLFPALSEADGSGILSYKEKALALGSQGGRRLKDASFSSYLVFKSAYRSNNINGTTSGGAGSYSIINRSIDINSINLYVYSHCYISVRYEWIYKKKKK